ncbi:MAG: MFS transporter [Promethearchaeota archaeon]
MASVFERSGYLQRIRLFSPNAKKLILSNTIGSFGWGVQSAIFNIYLLTLGYSNTFLGGVMGLGAFSMAICSLLVGPFVARVGTKNALILGSLIHLTISIPRVLTPFPEIFVVGAVLSGISSAMGNVAFAPFIAKSSTSYERTHLFGTNALLAILSNFAGSTLAGFLPGWASLVFLLPIDSAPSFQLALIGWILPIILNIIPILAIREFEDLAATETLDKAASPRSSAPEPKGRKELFILFAIPTALIGLGAGFVVPFLSVFFWDFYDLPTPLVGFIQGLGQLTVATGSFISPGLSTRLGKVRTVVLCQTLSLPFLFLIAVLVNPVVAIACFLLRGALMNMTGPVDSGFKMEMVPHRWRAYLTSVNSFAWNFPWAISTQITGPLFDADLYLLPFWFTLACYSASTVLYAVFFRSSEKRLAEELAS